jgi:hypothetical protein
MAKKFTKTERKPISPRPVAKRADRAYPVEQEDLDEQQQRLRKAAAAGAAALTPAIIAPAGEPPASSTVLSKPLAALAALWPDSAPSNGESQPSQGPSFTTAAPLRQPPAQSPPPKSPERATAAPTTSATAPKTLGVSFAIHKPDAKRVSLCGDFNGWLPTATPMKRRDDGRWEATVALTPGRYQYKFIADEEWINDPAAQQTMPNEHGSLNSVVEVGI